MCCFKKIDAIKTCVSEGGFNCSDEKICFLSKFELLLTSILSVPALKSNFSSGRLCQ